jgi:hypothetical protein
VLSVTSKELCTAHLDLLEKAKGWGKSIASNMHLLAFSNWDNRIKTGFQNPKRCHKHSDRGWTLLRSSRLFLEEPRIRKSFEMTSIIHFSTRRSSQLLVPHLSPWLHHHHAVDPIPYPKWSYRLLYYAEDEDYVAGEDEDAEDAEAEEDEEMEIDSEEVEDIKQNAEDEKNETMVEIEDDAEKEEEMKENDNDEDNKKTNTSKTLHIKDKHGIKRQSHWLVGLFSRVLH